MSFSMREAKNAWMYNKCKDLEKLIVVADYATECNNHDLSDKTYQQLCDMTLSLLLVTLGWRIPTRIYTVNDYSDFCDILFDNSEKLGLEND